MTTRPLKENNGNPRVITILLACLVGFIGGEVLATIFTSILNSTLHFPGGLSALVKTAKPPYWFTLCGLLGLWCGFVATVLYAKLSVGLSLPKSLFTLKASDAIYVFIGVATQLLIDSAYWPFHFKNMNKPVDHIFGSVHGSMFVLLAFLTTFAAPLIEEILFRGVVFRSLDALFSNMSKKFGSFAAMALSAFIFAIAHAELLQFAGLFALGIVLSYIVKKTNRLAPSILAHMSFNAVALIALLLQRTGH